MSTTESRRKYTRAEIASIVEQLQAITLDGALALDVQFDEECYELEAYAFVQLKTRGAPYGSIMTFALDIGEGAS